MDASYQPPGAGGPVVPAWTGWKVAALLALLLLCGNALYVSSRLGFLHAPKQVLEADHHRYVAMAQSPPGRFVVEAPVPPFCWRILAPGVVFGLGRLGLDLNVAFYATSNLFLFGFLMGLYRYLRLRGFVLAEALLGLLLAGLLPGGLRWYEYQYWMPDPAGLCLVAWSLVWIEERRDGWLLVAAVAGAAARESYLIVLPYLLLRALQQGSWRSALRRSAVVGGVALAVLLLIRLAITAAAPYDVPEILERMWAFRMRHLWRNQLYFMTAGTWGVLLPLGLLFPLRAWRWVRERPQDLALVAVAYASLLMANNTDRLLVYALPAILPAVLAGIRRWCRLAGVGALWPALAAVASQVFVYVETPYHKLGISLFQPTNLRVVTVLALLWVAAQAGCLLGRQRRVEGTAENT